MKKKLWMGVVLYAFLPVHGEQKAAQTETNNTRPEQSADVAGHAVPAIDQEAPRDQQQRPKDEPQGYFHTLIAPNNLPNILLVIVGVGGIVVAICSVQATAGAAKAALLNAQAVINSERAWILVEHDAPASGFDTWMFTFTGKNWGKAPAEIIFFEFHNTARDADVELPEIPPYEGDDSEFVQREWIPPGETFRVAHCNALSTYKMGVPQVWEEFNNGHKWLWLYGVVRYRDALSAAIHETRFCYFKSPANGVNLLPGGPARYTRCT